MPRARDLLAREGAPLEPAPDRIGTDPQHGRSLAHGDRRSPSVSRRSWRAAYPLSGLWAMSHRNGPSVMPRPCRRCRASQANVARPGRLVIDMPEAAVLAALVPDIRGHYSCTERNCVIIERVCDNVSVQGREITHKNVAHWYHHDLAAGGGHRSRLGAS